jgi:hypothetical protein
VAKTPRRRDTPWEELERLYVQGEIPPDATKVTERSWPSTQDLATRFKVLHRTVRDRALRHQWSSKREAWKHTLRDDVARQSQAYVQNAAEVLGNAGAQVVANTTLLLAEIEYTVRFYRELLPASPDKSPFADVSEPLVPTEPEAPPDPSAPPKIPKPRRPVPSRTVLELSNAQRTLYDTLRAIYGVAPSQALPGSGGHNREESPVSTSVPATEPSLPAEVMFAVVDTIAERNKAPKKDGG